METKANARVTLKELDKNHVQRKKRGYRWLVESRINGKRVRKFFKHGQHTEAEEHRDEILERADNVGKSDRDMINEDFLREAVGASKALAPFGKSIAEAVGEVVEASKVLTPFDESISDAVAFYVAHLEAKAKQDSTSLNEAIGIFLEAKINKGIKDDTVKRYRETLNRFLLSFPDRTVSSFESDEIERWWETFGSVANQRANRTDVNVFFNWLVKSSRFKNLIVNPVPAPPEMNKKLKLAKKRVILSPAEVKRLLNACDEAMLPIIVAQVLIGVRPEESLRLDWGHFDFEAEELNITADIAKGGEKHARTNKIPKNALKWLLPYRFKESGRVLPGVDSKSAFDKRLRKLRAKAGWEPGKWPQNALRKTFISCHYASYSEVSKTAAIAGTSESIIFSNYRTVVNKTIAKKLWKIQPGKNGEIISTGITQPAPKALKVI
jgi:integrase